MADYTFFNIPPSCEVNHTIFKKLFYENADLSAADQRLFTEVIKKITWLYSIKPGTINVQAYKDEVREYQEIEFIEIELTEEKRLGRIAEIIMRTIPYPMVLIFTLQHKMKLYAAHQRTNLSDSSKNTLEEMMSTDWIVDQSLLMEKLDIQKMRFSNLYALYSDIVDGISLYRVTSYITSDSHLSGDEARTLIFEIEELEMQIAALKSKLKNETQFNKKMELNIEIKKLNMRKSNLTGGNESCKKSI